MTDTTQRTPTTTTHALRLPLALPAHRAGDSATTSTALAAATLASLRGATPRRLHCLFTKFGSPPRALAAVLGGRAAEALPRDRNREFLAARWAEMADPLAVAAALERRSTRVFVTGQPGFPVDPRLYLAPAVLFAEGERHDVLDRPRVAIVGTRAATPPGLADAHEIGRYLAEQGITIVSGLAIGIDAAAHAGALEAGGGVVGVVATGLDVVYPRRHAQLYNRVRRQGLVLGENWFGVPPARPRFPIRNRIIAALCDAVVVVEATATGGAKITADIAARYGRTVLAVPGSRRNPASAGCNALIADGAQVLQDPSDVVSALALGAPASAYAVMAARAAAEAAAAGSGAGAGWNGPTVKVGPAASRLHASMAAEPATLDQLVERSGLALGEVAGLIRELEAVGRMERARGLLWPL